MHAVPKPIRFAIWLLLAGLASLTHAQQPEDLWEAFAQPLLNRITTVDGLPANSITTLAQDSKGYLWIGTANGLARYDGQHVYVIGPQLDNPRGLPDGYIRAVRVLTDGRLLVGTNNGGLVILDPATMLFTPVPVGTARSLRTKIFALRPARDGSVWVTSDLGLDRFDPRTDTSTPIPLRGYPAHFPQVMFDVAEAKDGRLWLGTARGLFTRDPGRTDFRQLRDKHYPGTGLIWSLYLDRHGRLWVGTDANGLFVVDPDGRRWAPPELYGADGLTHGHTVRDYLETGDGRLFISTYGSGVIECADKACSHPRVIESIRTDPSTLASNTVHALLLDTSGTLWFGTARGLSYTPLSHGAVVHVRGSPTKLPALINQAVTAILVDNRQRVWLGLDDAGVVVLDLVNGTSRHLQLPGHHARQPVTALAQTPDGTVWVGGLGIVGYDPDTLTPKARMPAMNEQRITALSVEQDALLISTYYGTSRYVDGGLQTVFANGVLKNIHWTLRTGQRRWFATIHGLAMQTLDAPDAASLRWFQHHADDPRSLPQDFVSMLAWDTSRKRLWIANRGGLVWLQPDGDKPDHFHPTLPRGERQRITAVVLDAAGNAWATGDDRLIRVDAATLKITTLAHRDGLPDGTFIWRTAALGPSGEILFGSTTGLTVVHPPQLPNEDYHPAPLRISQVRINGKVLPLAAGISGELSLTAEQRSISVDFSLLDFRAPHDVRYSYRLTGFEEIWHALPASTPASAVYTNLPTGHFQLELRARVDGLNAHTITTHYRLSVAPRWHETWPARLLLLVALLLLAAGFVYVGLLWSRHRQRALDGMIARRTFELREANHKLTTLATTDVLTNLYSRRAFMERAGHALDLAAAQQRQLSILLIDLDEFKKINDLHGHLAGDAVLRAAAHAIASACREVDVAGRYGGEELVICMPDSGASAAWALAERLRENIAALRISHDGALLSVTCSIGIASRGTGEDVLAQLLARADKALYAAKAAGRNRTLAADAMR